MLSLIVTSSSAAQLSARYRPGSSQLRISIAAPGKCPYSLRASPGRKYQSRQAIRLARGVTAGSRTSLTASGIAPIVGRARSIALQFSARCSRQTLRDTAGLSLPKSQSGFSSFRNWANAVAAALALPAATPTPAVTPTSVALTNALPAIQFNAPVSIENAHDGSNRLFILEQDGIIWAVSGGQRTPFLDITSRVLSGGEQGLLGLAFHPAFNSNGIFFTNYTRRPDGATVIARYHANTARTEVDVSSEEVILLVPQPYANHNGGQLAFGPDGYLYIGLGDGGSGGDPQGNGQKLSTVLGKILRIDIDRRDGSNLYGIPSDNPFRGDAGARGEIWAYGLRNPWRFSFDAVNGRLWAGDVGQNEVEEIDLIERGKNYGWNRMEGTHCYPPGSSCSQTGLTPPVAEYTHSDGIAVIGGTVYRGSAIPGLAGFYLYGDFQSGKVWAFNSGESAPRSRLLISSGKSISAFGTDEGGEMYLASYGDGQILKFVSG